MPLPEVHAVLEPRAPVGCDFLLHNVMWVIDFVAFLLCRLTYPQPAQNGVLAGLVCRAVLVSSFANPTYANIYQHYLVRYLVINILMEQYVFQSIINNSHSIFKLVGQCNDMSISNLTSCPQTRFQPRSCNF